MSAPTAPEARAALELRSYESIRDLGEQHWSALAGDAPPFLSFDWLDALEQTGCVRPERGWMPMHLGLWRGDELVAAAPAYVKGNSEGEFVFDHSFAQFAESRLHVDYYPKLIVAVPFTPATGPRLLVAPGVDLAAVHGAFAAGLEQLCERLGLSSAHVLFPPRAEAELLSDAGLVHRYGLQFHWHNAGYACFDDFLARFSAKRRHQIRRERRDMERQGIDFRILSGSDIDAEAVDVMFEFYRATVEKFYWGRQYLNRNFFHEVASRMPGSLHFVLARERSSGQALGGAFNLLGGDKLYGRYWGAAEERPFLHFNVCYYQGVEDAIARGLSLFEPGAGGEHKLARGFEPTLTHSAHHFADSRLDHAVRDYCAREREALDDHIADSRRDPLLKPV